MCLIAYSPDGTLLDRDVFDFAATENPDGIGIMSEVAIQKFIGKRYKRRAWQLIQRLSEDRIPYALHFRWRTHGPIVEELCHPFKSPDSNTYVMHNGIINGMATAMRVNDSDTSAFVREFMDLSHAQAPDALAQELDAIGHLIGYGNKLCVFQKSTGRFNLVNQDEGIWIEGIWYSNEYSLPAHMTAHLYRTWNYGSTVSPTFTTNGGRGYGYEADKATVTALKRGSGRKQRRGKNDRSLFLPVDGEDTSQDDYYRVLAAAAGFHDDGHTPERMRHAALTERHPMDEWMTDDESYAATLRRIHGSGGGY